MDDNGQAHDLIDLKRQINETITPLIPHLKSAVDRYHAYESLLRDSWSDELAYRALAEAKQIEDPEEKFYNLQSLNSVIYFHDQELRDLQENQS